MKLPIPADVYIEQDALMVAEAREQGYNAYEGDIRSLWARYDDFDTVIDLSTIDHIPDYELALHEYAYVLHEGGHLLLVVWLGNMDTQKMTDWEGFQYYFPEDEFRAELTKYFLIVDEEVMLGSHHINIGHDSKAPGPGNHYLKYFYCAKL